MVVDGGNSTFQPSRQQVVMLSVNDLVAVDARGYHKAAYGGNSGSGNLGGVWW
jgi:hypothetical protein